MHREESNFIIKPLNTLTLEPRDRWFFDYMLTQEIEQTDIRPSELTVTILANILKVVRPYIPVLRQDGLLIESSHTGVAFISIWKSDGNSILIFISSDKILTVISRSSNVKVKKEFQCDYGNGCQFVIEELNKLSVVQ